jgi:hypothetical protein
MGQFLIKMEGQLRFLEEKCHNFLAHKSVLYE